jgi:hypothetical protein
MGEGTAEAECRNLGMIYRKLYHYSVNRTSKNRSLAALSGLEPS